MNKLLRLILLFFFLFDISFINIPISTGKISALLFLLIYISKNNIKIPEKVVGFQLMAIIFIALATLYNVMQYIIFPLSDGTTMMRMIYFVIYTLIMSSIIPSFFSDINDFFKSVGYVTTIQGIFVFISWISRTYRVWLSRLVINTGNISFLSARRPPGFMSSAGAGSSVILAVGSVLLFWLLLSEGTKNKYITLIGFVISLIATFIVGRTGFIVAVALIGIIILEKIIKQPSRLKTLILFAPIIILLVLGATNVFLTYLPQQVSLKFEWFFGEFGDGLLSGDTVTALKSMTIRPIGWETMIGTGQIRPIGGSHDAGYIQNYHSMGLILAILFYVFVFLHIRYLYLYKLENEFKKKNKMFILMLTLVMFIIELKEPFIFYYIYPWIVLSILKSPFINIKLEETGGLTNEIKYNNSGL